MENRKAEPTPWDIDAITLGLRDARARWRSAQQSHAEFGAGFPSRRELDKITAGLCAALFPLRLGPNWVRVENEDDFVRETLGIALRRLQGQLCLELGNYGDSLLISSTARWWEASCSRVHRSDLYRCLATPTSGQLYSPIADLCFQFPSTA